MEQKIISFNPNRLHTLLSTKNFAAIVLLTLIFYGLLRFIGWRYFSSTDTWNSLNVDYWHHWQLGIALIIFGLIIFSKRLLLRDILAAIGSGQIIDELTYAIFPQESIVDSTI